MPIMSFWQGRGNPEGYLYKNTILLYNVSVKGITQTA